MGYSLCKILDLGQTFKLSKTCQNRFCIRIGENLCKETARKKPQIFQKQDDVDNRPSKKPCEKKQKQNKTKKDKQKQNKKHQVYTKRDDVDNRPYCKGCSHCMGYCLCKILNLSQTFKSPKTCQNRFCIHIGEILEKKKKKKNKQTNKKRLVKTPDIPEMRRC